MITITLQARNMKPRTYQDDARMRECMDAFDLARKWEEAAGEYPEALIQEAAEFIARCFGNQFTAEELMDGYRGSPYALIPDFLRRMVGYVADEIVDFPPKAAKAKARG